MNSTLNTSLNTPATTRLAGFAFAFVMTAATLLSINGIATSDASAGQLARLAPATHAASQAA
jgi:hypothetical protein